MHIYIDGTQYNVSMTWNPDDSLDHYVTINDQHYRLDVVMTADLDIDDERYQTFTHQELRELFAEQIQKILDELDER